MERQSGGIGKQAFLGLLRHFVPRKDDANCNFDTNLITSKINFVTILMRVPTALGLRGGELDVESMEIFFKTLLTLCHGNNITNNVRT